MCDWAKDNGVACPGFIAAYGTSIHNRGAAVDLTVLDASEEVLDMGTGFDDFENKARTDNETSSGITSNQRTNRKILRDAMELVKFAKISSEWWHFNEVSKEYVKSNYGVFDF